MAKCGDGGTFLKLFLAYFLSHTMYAISPQMTTVRNVSTAQIAPDVPATTTVSSVFHASSNLHCLTSRSSPWHSLWLGFLSRHVLVRILSLSLLHGDHSVQVLQPRKATTQGSRYYFTNLHCQLKKYLQSQLGNSQT